MGVPQAPLLLETCTLQVFPVGKEEQECEWLGQVCVTSLPNARTECTNECLVYVAARCFQHHSQLGWILSLVSCKRRDFLLSQGPPELLCKAEGFLSLPVKTGTTPSVRDDSEAPSGGSVFCWVGFQPFSLSSPLS